MKHLDDCTGNLLILGISHLGKDSLKDYESNNDTAILDCWYKVQNIVITEDTLNKKSSNIQFIRSLSYFIEEPEVAIRFSNNKFQETENIELVPEINYQNVLATEKKNKYSNIVSNLKNYKKIIVIVEAANEFVNIWLHDIVGDLFKSHVNLHIITVYPATFEGKYRKEISDKFITKIKELKIPYEILYKNQICKEFPNSNLREIYCNILHHIKFSIKFSLKPL